jgi:endonuclease III
MARSSSDLRAIGHFKTALDILDAGEPQLREIIESGLIDVSGINATKANMVEQAVQAVLAQYAQERAQQFKSAFRYLRANLE